MTIEVGVACAAGALVTVFVSLRAWRKRRANSLVEKREILRQESLAAIVKNAIEGDNPLLGLVLGDYRVVKEIGSGGFAKVYLGLPDSSLDEERAVAIKVLKPRADGAAALYYRFQREAETLLQLLHPNIVRLVDYGGDANQPFIVTEFVSGETLREKLHKGGKLAATEVAALVCPICEALAYAHRRGVIHRDLKPENVMTMPSRQNANEERVVVMDFGLARSASYSQNQAGKKRSLIGTPCYMAPELMKGQIGPALDQYALGVMAFEMLTGKLPFDDKNLSEILRMQVQEKPPRPRELEPSIPKEVEAAVLKMLAKRPSKRFEDMEDVLLFWKKYI